MIKILNNNSESDFISENSNFDIFNLSNSILKGDLEESLKILEHLKLQRGSEALIIWGPVSYTHLTLPTSIQV